jgi:glycogen operon protein
MIEEQAPRAGTGPAPYRILPGRTHPLGATPDAYGVNFAVYCGHATNVELLLFGTAGHALPEQVIVLDRQRNHTFMFWHVYVVGLRPGARYAFRVDGEFDPHGTGDRYDRSKVLIDPYARVTALERWNRARASVPGDNVDCAMQSVVIDLKDYDWEGDQPLHLPMSETVIYELHVRGFTRSPSAEVEHPGTFAGLIAKIPYLQRLGITAVELLPICQFDPQEPHGANPFDGSLLVNYWGYNTVSFFSPHHAYCVSLEPGTHIREFRDLVKALHRAGIEVILDMVFNHTSEGDEYGPTIHFKGLANSTYYYLNPEDRAHYLDYTGVMNTVNCNHPVVAKLITDCLEFWVQEMHVDGFRFDEGSVLSRGEDGQPMLHPPVVWSIELSDALADVKVIAEAWDAAGLYQVGEFPGRRWALRPGSPSVWQAAPMSFTPAPHSRSIA